MIILRTTFGNISLELDYYNTKVTAENFLEYARAGFYDGTLFHRVIDDFMIQGGGFKLGMKAKETRDPIKNEADKGESNQRGTIAMARTLDPHSATSQFFINVKDNPFLDFRSKTKDGWGYCVFGKVIEGIDVVDRIKQVPTTTRAGYQNVPIEEVMIKEVIS